ncbi:MAG TPA: hypothetical protein VIZ28_20340 [Chitinophagaceae bacterium]
MKKALCILLLFCSIQAISQTTVRADSVVVVQAPPPQQARPPQSGPPKPGLRLNAYANYVFDDRVDSYYSATSYYEGTVKAGLQWGVGLEYMVRAAQGIELIWLHEDTKAPTTYYDNGVKTREFDLSINYIMIGSTRYFPVKPAVEPYFGIHLGVGIVDVSNPTNGSETNSTKFAWGLKLGTNIWASQKIGIKLQAGLQSMAQAAGGGLYFGTGGAGAGLSTYSTIYQFSLGGGLVFKFGTGQ